MCNDVTSLSSLHDGMMAIDAIISKAIGIPELTQTAKIEINLRKLLLDTWAKSYKNAISKAIKKIRAGSGEISDSEINSVVSTINREMGDWYKGITESYTSGFQDIYELSHLAAAKKGLRVIDTPMDFAPSVLLRKAEFSVAPSFDIVDENAIDALKAGQVYWIGNHYSENLTENIAKTTRDTVIEAGRGREDAAKLLRSNLEKTFGEIKIPDGFNGSADQYFEMVVSSAATTGRTQAQVNAFYRLGYTTYTIVNPMDQRTCERCAALDGKQFYVSDGMDLMRRVSSAKNPDSVKRIQPFISLSETRSMIDNTKKGPEATRKLAANGNALPPYHGGCRCNIDVASDASAPPVDIREPEKPRKPISVPKKPLPPNPPKGTKYAEIDYQVLSGEAKDLRKIWDTSVKNNDFRRARTTFESLLSKHWGFTRSEVFGKSNVIKAGSLRTMRNVPGLFRPTSGRISLRSDVVKNTSSGIDRTIRQAITDTEISTLQISSFKTLTHEVIHSCNKMAISAYVESGKAISEITTEIAARRVVLDIASEKHINAVSAPEKFGYRAYQGIIDQAKDDVVKVTGWSIERAEREIEQASLKLQTDVTIAKTEKEYVSSFIEALPGYEELSRSKVESMNNELGKLRIKKK